MLNKAIKVVSVIGGIVVFSELFGTLGEAQAIAAIHKEHPDEMDKMLDAMRDEEATEDLNGYQKFKLKCIAGAAEILKDL